MAPKSVTISLLDQTWVESEYRTTRLAELRRFQEETGISVELLPAPETAVEQIALWRKLLHEKSRVPDVYAVDVIWPGVLADQLADLRSDWRAQELNDFLPGLIQNDTVSGRLVAVPYQVGAGLLFYRTDLVRKYGYRGPPATWTELEQMATRIQAGERRLGNEHFWGFVWQGAASEALTCNALEWQASEGGGRIIENDGRISVNNPRAIHAWQRAAHWVGTISPPGVVAYKEWDSNNVWLAGQAAFMRNWPGSYVLTEAAHSSIADKFAITELPAGAAGHDGTLGGPGYGVSKYSSHPKEARMLVQFLCSRRTALVRCSRRAEPPAINSLYSDPTVLAANPYFRLFRRAYDRGIVLRPSKVAGANYPAVSRAYFTAVHSVINGEQRAESAAAELEQKLASTMGRKVSQP